jgi:hypothetical protein
MTCGRKKEDKIIDIRSGAGIIASYFANIDSKTLLK